MSDSPTKSEEKAPNNTSASEPVQPELTEEKQQECYELEESKASPTDALPADETMQVEDDSSSVEQDEATDDTDHIPTTTATNEPNELNDEEKERRNRLVSEVKRGDFESGFALLEIRDDRLYRDTHPDNFKGYCRDILGRSKQGVNYLIAGAEIYEILETTNSCRVLPTSETQVRDIAGLRKKEKVEIWNEAVEIVNKKNKPDVVKVPSRRVVKGVVDSRKEKPSVKDSPPYTVGEVLILTGFKNKEDRKYNDCVAIAQEIKDSKITVDFCYGTLVVTQDQLNYVDSQPKKEEFFKLSETLKRIKKLLDYDRLNLCIRKFLEELGKEIKLDPEVDQVLKKIEQLYGFSQPKPITPDSNGQNTNSPYCG